MTTWVIEPRDPLIARDGKPFSATPGARAASLNFPYPSTTTGAVRTREGSDANGVFDVTKIPQVKNMAVRGPLLVELDPDGEIQDWLLPVPADALLLEKEASGTTVIRKRLVPLELPTGTQTDLAGSYSLVGMVKPDPRKPYSQAPRFWHWEKFKQWLVNPADAGTEESVIVNELGHNGPTTETRTHLKVNPLSQTAEEGFLFQTRGMEYTWTKDGPEPFTSEPRRLGLAIATSAGISNGLSTLGGERRTVFWRKSNQLLVPACPADLPKQIAGVEACRVVLLTPAIFQEGWRPDDASSCGLLAQRHGVKPRLVAAALPRYQVISGWDYENRCPKPTRRLVTAGAVFFLKLEKKEPNANIEQWAKDVWASCLSDDAQDCRDGFGLVALGVWSGQPQPMEFDS